MLEPAPHTEERLRAIPNAISGLNPDIVLLQEVYQKEHVERIIRELEYPYIVRTRMHFPMQSGLLLLSRHRVSHGRFVPFRSRLAEDRIVDKGFIVASIATHLGDITIVNLHVTAGGRLPPDHPKVERVRSVQLREAMDALEALSTDQALRVLAGDFNAGAEASAVNIREVLDRGYRDTFVPRSPFGFTWDPKNPLNAQGPHATCPPQRCDYVFVNGGSVRAESDIVLTEATVQTPSGARTCSDHYGVRATIST